MVSPKMEKDAEVVGVITDRFVCPLNPSIQRTNVWWALGMPVQCPPTNKKNFQRAMQQPAAAAAACCFLPLNSVTRLQRQLSLKYKIKQLAKYERLFFFWVLF